MRIADANQMQKHERAMEVAIGQLEAEPRTLFMRFVDAGAPMLVDQVSRELYPALAAVAAARKQ